MWSLGINLPSTLLGKALRDGGACLAKDGQIVEAIAEERLSRQPHAPGYSRAMEFVLRRQGLVLSQIQHVGVSSCCEPLRKPENVTIPDVESACISIVSHHLSHAVSAFQTSGFHEAIIVVIDAGGNVLEDSLSPTWWKQNREQHSFYFASQHEFKLLQRDFVAPFSAGVGEAFRAITKFLGFGSQTNSAKTMALAAYGIRGRFASEPCFYFESGDARSRLVNNPENPIGMISTFIQECLKIPVAPRNAGDTFSQVHFDLASYFQLELENYLLSRVSYFINETGCHNVCYAGGVALNCKANSRLLEMEGMGRLHIFPAAGDSGQCVGNALFPFVTDTSLSPSSLTHAFWGGDYDAEAIISEAKSKYRVTPPSSDTPFVVAKLLADGNLVAVFEGRSELGPRALGHRSILADPRTLRSKERLDGIKSHETFMPYAPSVLEAQVAQFFEFQGTSPFMLLTARARDGVREVAPAICHVDGSARLQSLSHECDMIFNIVKAFYALTGVPLLLNTSFNRRSEPICESPLDALNCFAGTGIDHLLLNGHLISKSNRSIPGPNDEAQSQAH
jgi:carbamoyltransferase